MYVNTQPVSELNQLYLHLSGAPRTYPQFHVHPADHDTKEKAGIPFNSLPMCIGTVQCWHIRIVLLILNIVRSPVWSFTRIVIKSGPLFPPATIIATPVPNLLGSILDSITNIYFILISIIFALSMGCSSFSFSSSPIASSMCCCWLASLFSCISTLLSA